MNLSGTLDYLHEISDRRNDGRFLMDNWISAALVLGIYLIAVLVGVHFKSYLRFSSTTKDNIFYATGLVGAFFNIFVATQLTWTIYKLNYCLTCQKLGPYYLLFEDYLAFIQWLFLMVKILEMIDTYFAIMSKAKYKLEVTIFHHSTVYIIAWVGARFLPGGSSSILAMFSSWFHVVTYLYHRIELEFLLSSQTLDYIFLYLQISHFALLIFHCITGLYSQCGYPPIAFKFMIAYILIMGSLYVALNISNQKGVKFDSMNNGNPPPEEPPKKPVPKNSGVAKKDIFAPSNAKKTIEKDGKDNNENEGGGSSSSSNRSRSTSKNKKNAQIDLKDDGQQPSTSTSAEASTSSPIQKIKNAQIDLKDDGQKPSASTEASSPIQDSLSNNIKSSETLTDISIGAEDSFLYKSKLRSRKSTAYPLENPTDSDISNPNENIQDYKNKLRKSTMKWPKGQNLSMRELGE